jgi:hypothetical protein
MTRKTGKTLLKAKQQMRAARIARAKRELAAAGVSLKLKKPPAKVMKEKEKELKELYLEMFPEAAVEEKPIEEAPAVVMEEPTEGTQIEGQAGPVAVTVEGKPSEAEQAPMEEKPVEEERAPVEEQVSVEERESAEEQPVEKERAPTEEKPGEEPAQVKKQLTEEERASVEHLGGGEQAPPEGQPRRGTEESKSEQPESG